MIPRTVVYDTGDAYRQLSISLFRWSLEDARREQQQGFCYVKRLKSTQAAAYLRFVDNLNPEEKGQFATALVKRAHAPLIGPFDEMVLSSEEGRLLACFESYQAANSWKWSTPARGIRRPRGTLVRDAIVNRLMTVFGGRPQAWEGGVLRYRSAFPPWTLETFVDYGGRIPLRYHHEIGLEDRARLPQALSFLTWLGVGETNWDLMQEEDIGDSVTCLSDLCTHFLAALKGIIIHTGIT